MKHATDTTLTAAYTPSIAIPRAPRPVLTAPVLDGPVRPDLNRDEVLGEVFQSTVQGRGYRVAYISGDKVWTYAQVQAETDAIARGLVAQGIGPGHIVGLWMARGVELLMAQIAITKSGAAWLPFDADAPVERISVCLADAQAKGILTSAAFIERAEGTGVAVWTSAALLERAAPGALPNPRARGLTADSPAYLIYTSGSTGTPKGIVISHRNICHFLRSANEVYGFASDDVVFQGASVAFDLSMEEIWVPYLVGATLFVATPEMIGDVERLPDLMIDAGVTVLDTVPTLLAMLPRDIPSLRIILLGGEALPSPLVARWARPGRRIFNTYGPTEATVVATVAEVLPGEAVTIGRPIPNYTCYIADDDLNPVADGQQGELLIGGPGVAAGYLGRPELTAQKFVANPFADQTGIDPVLYRSGDAVSLDGAGNIVFHGRIDDQVKIRGFRVELGEIEAKLADFPHVAHVAVVLRQDNGLDRLVAFLVPEPGQTIDRLALRLGLRDRLPSYMVPAHFELVDTLPRLTSGKIDRKVLKAASLTAAEALAEDEPRTPAEAALLAAAKFVFPGQAIPFDADFFMDLGGHSLLAARFVSAVREDHAYAGITLQDVYGARTLRAMAAKLEAAGRGQGPRDLSFTPPPLLRRVLCGVGQAVALPFIIALMTAQWLGIFIGYMLLSGGEAGIGAEIAALLGLYLVINLVTIAISIVAKWLIIGRTKPGRYPLWGTYYFRWWLTTRLIGLAHIKWMQNSPLIVWYLRALGARIGKDTILAEIECGAFDLLTIGDGVCVGGKAKFATAEVVGNELVISAISIGKDAYVGTSCVLEGGVAVGEGAELADLTAVAAGTAVGPRQTWDGSPARHVGTVPDSDLPPRPTVGPVKRTLQNCAYVAGGLLIPPLGLLPIFPAFFLFDRLDDVLSGPLGISYLYYLPVLAWPTAFCLVLATIAFIVAARWVVLPRVSEGIYSVHSWFYVRKWVVSLATEVTLETLSTLYATVYMRGWYRLMGAKIGKDAEISTNLSGRYDLVEIGEKNFIADEVVLGDEDIRQGWMILKRVKTGARVFVGNDAVVPPGTRIPADALIGIKSKPPANDAMSSGDTWFGSPPIKLPVRQTFGDVAANWTYEPSRLRRLGRAVFEAFNLSLPTMLFISFGTLAVELLAPAILAGDVATLVPGFIGLSVAISMAMTAVVIGLKWLMMGAYKPTMKPMWTFWSLRTEATAVLYWGLTGKVLLEQLRGTPYLPWVLRLFGAKFGKGVFMDTTDITEFDCVEVGDFVAINAVAALQTHLYEDRLMKVGRVSIGNGVTIGAGATVLYDTKVGPFARIGPLTIVMKGESIPGHSEWAGAPAEPVAHGTAAAVVTPQLKSAA
ncbi:Pls/PosA family non-ribosomal peptide synthetase [Chelatococcus reniformis]|uniref:Peptide synthetase n=1 Tax=Chelatococcus reniformis TaxID=1494448 RepID=A0A916U8D9_9HYPH|nr:Pls/PosA family non-ribosomal peptide synthetase [Chelatococcus reniformis]GGC61795.1 peptide synthetase [Chelatococcus reniformis]